MSKICSHCKEVLPFSRFSKGGAKDGYQWECDKCRERYKIKKDKTQYFDVDAWAKLEPFQPSMNRSL